jgi:hypothetical protein
MATASEDTPYYLEDKSPFGILSESSWTQPSALGLLNVLTMGDFAG